VRRFVLDHARESGLPSLLVTHEPADAEAAGGRVIGFPHREETTTAQGVAPAQQYSVDGFTVACASIGIRVFPQCITHTLLTNEWCN